MEEVFPILTKDKSYISITMTCIPDNSWSKTLADTVTTTCVITQLQAGQIYEAQTNDMRTKDPYNFCYRYNGLKKLAATYYEMSLKVNTNVTANEAKLLLNHVHDTFEKALKEEKDTDKNTNVIPPKINYSHK